MVDELKAKAYDMEKLYEEYKKKMDAIIKEAEEKSAAIGAAKEEVVVEDENVNEQVAAVETEVVPAEGEVQDTAEEVVEENVSEIPEAAPVIPVEGEVQDTAEEVVEENVSEIPETTPVIPVENEVQNTTEEVVVPAIQPEVAYIESQPLDQEPLIPAVPETVEKEEIEFERTDFGVAKAISTSQKQSGSLRTSKSAQKERVLGKKSNSVVASEPVVDTDVEASTPVTQPSRSVEDIDAEMNAMVAELAITTDEARANEINKNLAELNEQKKKLVKVA